MAQCDCGKSALAPPLQPAPERRGRLSTRLTWRDIAGGFRVRCGFGRDNYRVAPGLYSIGTPGADSVVLVTANYKLTVDTVRRELAGLDAWLLILDTKGVNVWCAAGKGTFGTGELVRSIQASGLAQVVRHRQLVLPQLGATGVAAHEVKRATGFSVHYGPVRIRDISTYLAAKKKATPEMRRVTFNWKERLAVAPVEITGRLRPALIALAALAALQLVSTGGITTHLAADAAPFLAALLTGGILVPLLLPWLPSRSFAVKGAVAGLPVVAVSLASIPMGRLEALGVGLLVTAITSYMALMFTGSTTFTNLSGVRLEVRRALPPIIAAAGAGAVLRIAGAFIR
jgi:hypothetical protein